MIKKGSHVVVAAAALSAMFVGCASTAPGSPPVPPAVAEKAATESSLDALNEKFTELQGSVRTLDGKVAQLQSLVTDLLKRQADAPQPQAYSVGGTLRSRPADGNGEVINLDVAGGLPFGKIKRYSLTIDIGELVGARPGFDRIDVFTGVLSGNSTTDVLVASIDPNSVRGAGGITLPPYVGSNSFIRVRRGADGVDATLVVFNAYIEMVP